MKKIISLVVSILMIMGINISYAAQGTASPQKTEKYDALLNGVQHLKQSTIRMETEKKVIYMDPFGIDGSPMDADIVFVTHTHGDHFSTQDIKKVMKKGAALIITADGASAAKKEGIMNVTSVVPSKDYTVSGIKFKTVPAYNIDKQFHDKKSNWVGYVVNVNNANYYFAGDTDLIPEMKNIKADVAFLPVGGTYTMTANEAINAANIIKPRIAVPIHFSDIVGTTDDAQSFVRGLDKKIKGVVLKDLLKGITHLKQSTIRVQSDKVIYFDPFGIEGEPKDADIIFITHNHGDHFSIPDIKKVMKNDSILIVTKDIVDAIVKEGITNIVTVAPSNSYEISGLKFSTVPAYNIGKDFHKKEYNWVGYIININNTSYYMAGDTDQIPEIKSIKVNVIFLPVGGTYTMTAKEAVEAANIINPLIAVPIHFADVVGSMDDAKEFANSINEGIRGIILKK